MSKISSFLRLALVSGVALLVGASFSQAQYRRYRPGPVRPPVYRPIYPPDHMPGWDWWRTYPWSQYNYGRNPYNPIVEPYYVTPYRVYQPQSVPSMVIPSPTVPAPAMTGIEVSGPLPTPPPHTAVINLRVPSYWANVTINGQTIDSMGTSRTFVTPELSGRRSYTVAATWSGHGQQTRVHQTVQVEPGHVVSLDFTHRGS
jgi:uncharacterized protein (TIGR03000 family)